MGDISHAVQAHVEAHGYSVVQSMVGHGVGRDMHEDPQVPNFGPAGQGPELREGMVLAIEPMINVGGYEVERVTDWWAIYTKDGSLVCSFRAYGGDHQERARASLRRAGSSGVAG